MHKSAACDIIHFQFRRPCLSAVACREHGENRPHRRCRAVAVGSVGTAEFDLDPVFRRGALQHIAALLEYLGGTLGEHRGRTCLRHIGFGGVGRRIEMRVPAARHRAAGENGLVAVDRNVGSDRRLESRKLDMDVPALRQRLRPRLGELGFAADKTAGAQRSGGRYRQKFLSHGKTPLSKISASSPLQAMLSGPQPDARCRYRCLRPGFPAYTSPCNRKRQWP